MVVIGGAVAACGEGTGGGAGPGGAGGAGGAGGSGGSGGEAPCASECCPKEPFACASVDEAACQAKPGCVPVHGVPLGDDGEPSGSAVYLGCSSCTGSGDYQTCVVDPAQPTACYQVQTALVPDGWQEIFECNACLPGGE
ncbi:hypothetical protein WMF38_26085 [Sorangium sp. So ce118]